MFLDIEEMTELARRRFEVDVPARSGYGENKRAAEKILIERIDKEFDIETHYGDFAFRNKRIVDAETTRVPRLLMQGRWFPPITTASLRGGSKDGVVIALPSPRFEIEFSVLAEGWQDNKYGPDAILPKNVETYALAGWDTSNRTHVYYLTENFSDQIMDYIKLTTANVTQ